MLEVRLEFERAVAEHQGMVLRLCRSLLRDDHLGADAAQETFLRLWRRLGTGSEEDRPRRLRPWLRRVAVSVAQDQLRGGARRPRVLGDEDEAQAAPESEGAAERDLAARELEERLERALAGLSEGQRTVFLLRHEGRLGLREIADTLGVSLPTVKTQFARACLRLRLALRAHLEPDDDAPNRGTTP